MDSHEDIRINMSESCSEPEDSPPTESENPSIKFPRLSGDGSSIVVAQNQTDVTSEMSTFKPTQSALQPRVRPSLRRARVAKDVSSEHLAEDHLSSLALSEEDIEAFRKADATGRVKVKILLELPEAETNRHIKAVKHDLTEFYLALNTLLLFGEQNRITLTKLFKKHRKDMGGRQDRIVHTCFIPTHAITLPVQTPKG